MILTHSSGITATVHPLGATLRSLSTPDREGNLANILVGFKHDAEWTNNVSHFGTTIGRYANRIANGQFTLNGKRVQLTQNHGNHHLHGGLNSFSRAVWKTEFLSDRAVRFSYRSPAGEEGYPGNLDLTVDYILEEHSLIWMAKATTDEPTPINLTCHPYFNLTGITAASILDHELQILARKYLPVDSTLIPTGELRGVNGSGFDFQKPTPIGHNLNLTGTSFDHNYVLDETAEPNACCYDPASGRIMELTTNQPGMQLYLASPFGHSNSAFCLEPQRFPDSPNQAHFPNSILKPGEKYENFIRLRFI